jgi:hypothetical protein
METSVPPGRELPVAGLFRFDGAPEIGFWFETPLLPLPVCRPPSLASCPAWTGLFRLLSRRGSAAFFGPSARTISARDTGAIHTDAPGDSPAHADETRVKPNATDPAAAAARSLFDAFMVAPSW